MRRVRELQNRLGKVCVCGFVFHQRLWILYRANIASLVRWQTPPRVGSSAYGGRGTIIHLSRTPVSFVIVSILRLDWFFFFVSSCPHIAQFSLSCTSSNSSSIITFLFQFLWWRWRWRRCWWWWWRCRRRLWWWQV